MHGPTQLELDISPPPTIGVPDTIPVFPLADTVLLPGEILPLHIFETRYRSMVGDALATHRVIGIAEPVTEADGEAGLRRVGCLGFIAHHQELDDGRYLIWLLGLERFRIEEELEVPTLYRQVKVTYTPSDESQQELAGVLGLRRELRALLPDVFATDEKTRREMAGQLQEVSDTQLVALAAQILELDSDRKQEILEAKSLADRLVMLYEDLFTTMELTANHPEPNAEQLN